MTPPPTRSPRAALAAVVVLCTVGLAACGPARAPATVAPVVLTEDAVASSLDEGARPVMPPRPAPAGESTSPETVARVEPPTPVEPLEAGTPSPSDDGGEAHTDDHEDDADDHKDDDADDHKDDDGSREADDASGSGSDSDDPEHDDRDDREDDDGEVDDEDDRREEEDGDDDD